MKQHELTLLLCLIWALTLLYGEMFAFWVPPLLTCSWPHLLHTSSSTTGQTDSGNYQADYVKVAVIADPQLMDKTSLRLPAKSLALELVEFYTDLNMRRSFFASILPFKPEVILFLGDYFDGGPYLSDEEWQESFSRFRHIFGLNAQRKYTDMQVYYIPGNHDIGYESLHSLKPEQVNGRLTEGKPEGSIVLNSVVKWRMAAVTALWRRDGVTEDGGQGGYGGGFGFGPGFGSGLGFLFFFPLFPSATLASRFTSSSSTAFPSASCFTLSPSSPPTLPAAVTSDSATATSSDRRRRVFCCLLHHLLLSIAFFKSSTMSGDGESNNQSNTQRLAGREPPLILFILKELILHGSTIIQRYEETFGTRNYRFTVGNVDFIAVDAQTLDGSLYEIFILFFDKNFFFKRAITAELIIILLDDVVRPKVLLTHIPLYRPDDTYCGPDRSSPIINQRVHHTVNGNTNHISYQNYVSEESSKYLLDTINPKLILSGHDHDQCTVNHQSKYGSVIEHTIGTISWQQGNLYPSFMLLSVDYSIHPNSSIPEEKALLTHLCYLPMQTHIYIWYIVLFILTLLAALFWPTSGTSFWHQCCGVVGYCKQLITYIFSRSETKDKDEDANYEYEMMWDAEGTMHLVKKPLNVSTVKSNDRSLGERGNVVMRAAARKNTAQEGDLSVNVDMDSAARMPTRTGKSKTKIIIQRLIRTLRMLTVIAAVNVPLYMMLLFKDWIDK
ncbi:hypothetical protein Fmac_010776 [Flemingia macrophylla]|uniref:Calcineurin-like phosphoesterase domain-containing protein n=1 Tax=Flemingia macrophylla TaxID=520843 RepID=A0ABD1MKI9_9FABA